MSLIQWYRNHWPDVAGVAAAGIVGWLAIDGGRMPRARAAALASAAALGAHQVEEHAWPGGFAGHFNAGAFRSAQPWNYPTNAQSSLLVNAVAAYPFYALPVMFPKMKWLHMAEAMFNFTELAGHGVVLPLVTKEKSPGVVTAILLLTPTGIAMLREQARDGGLSGKDWQRAGIAMGVFAILGVALPQLACLDRDSPYLLPARELRPQDRDAAQQAGVTLP